jgi:hypothetical protein
MTDAQINTVSLASHASMTTARLRTSAIAFSRRGQVNIRAFGQ